MVVMESLYRILNQLGVNETFYIQFALIVVLFCILEVLVWKPLLKVFILRDQKTTEARKSAHDFEIKARDAQAEYKKRMDKIRLEASGIYGEIKEEALKREKGIIKSAEAEYRAKVGAAREEIGKELKSIQSSLQADAQQLASLIVEKALGRKV